MKKHIQNKGRDGAKIRENKKLTTHKKTRQVPKIPIYYGFLRTRFRYVFRTFYKIIVYKKKKKKFRGSLLDLAWMRFFGLPGQDGFVAAPVWTLPVPAGCPF